MLQATTIRELMCGHLAAEIVCAGSGKVICRLVIVDDTCDIDAITDSVGIPADTKLERYTTQPFTHSSVLFSFDDGAGKGLQSGKLCSEYDLIRFDDNTTQAIVLPYGVTGPIGPTGHTGRATVGPMGHIGPTGPVGPTGSVQCAACEGTGQDTDGFSSYDCGDCDGTGRVA